MAFQNVQAATSFGFGFTSLESWQGIADIEVSMPKPGNFGSVEAFMVDTIVQGEARRVIQHYATQPHGEAVEFPQWIKGYVLENSGRFLHHSSPMNNSTSLMSNLEEQMRISFWTPVITHFIEQVLAEAK